MSQPFHCVEGIILRVIPYGDYDQILTLFTAEIGLIKLFFKGSRSKRRGLQGICIPLTGVQVVYKEKNSELFTCQEMALIEPYRFLRRELIHLEAACELLKIIDLTQLPCKPAPHLYALLLYFLARLPECSDPSVLTNSFRLKLLKYEGMLSFPLECATCQEEIACIAYQDRSDSYCEAHRMPGTQRLEMEDIKLLDHLTNCQSFSGLIDLSLSPEFKYKIAQLTAT
jgi:DNA repair protein RecO (recombination protein O)